MTFSQNDFPALHGPGDKERGIPSTIRGHRLYPFSYTENPLVFFSKEKDFVIR